MRRGLSLIELLASIAIVALITGAVVRTLVAGIQFQSRSNKTFTARSDRIRLEDTLRKLLTGANLHGQGSYFVSPVPSSTTSGNQSPLGPGTGSLVFTTSQVSPPAPYLVATDQPFEDLNARFGPISDCAEVALSTAPVGNAGRLQGLFLRKQSPADADPTQGGEEQLLSPDIRDIRFEFYDGSDWTEKWDSRSDNKGKLPAAVRITYLLQTETQPRELLVRLPLSDLFTGAKSS